MSQSTTVGEVEIEAIRKAYAALNANDIAGFVAPFDEGIERIEPPDFPMAGTYRGLAAVKEHVAAGRGTWAEGTCSPTQILAAGDKVIAICDIHVRLKNSTDFLDGRIADVFTFRDGKAIGYRTFGEVNVALAWAGIEVVGTKSSNP